MTRVEKALAVLAAELQRHALFLNQTPVRSMTFVIKWTPTEPRAVITTFETEQTYSVGSAEPRLDAGGEHVRPLTMGVHKKH